MVEMGNTMASRLIDSTLGQGGRSGIRVTGPEKKLFAELRHGGTSRETWSLVRNLGLSKTEGSSTMVGRHEGVERDRRGDGEEDGSGHGGRAYQRMAAAQRTRRLTGRLEGNPGTLIRSLTGFPVQGRLWWRS
ncbi:hypothetical protein CLOP_g21855 [Closterium sp. NIES-67]|nr:hypothetical protein CLOP_g21855 [Closterium sp. NIES-67]